MKRRWSLPLVALLLTASLAGCGRQQLARQRWETIYIGQPAWDVREIMGQPTYEEPDKWTYVHAEVPYYHAVIRFADGKVVGKDWSYEPLEEREQGTGTGDPDPSRRAGTTP